MLLCRHILPSSGRKAPHENRNVSEKKGSRFLRTFARIRSRFHSDRIFVKYADFLERTETIFILYVMNQVRRNSLMTQQQTGREVVQRVEARSKKVDKLVSWISSTHF